MDFAELKNDTDFISKTTNLEDSIRAIEKHMGLMHELPYEDLSKEDKVKYDLFQSFAINSLFFMYLKLQGIDPSNVSMDFLRKKAVPRLNASLLRFYFSHTYTHTHTEWNKTWIG